MTDRSNDVHALVRRALRAGAAPAAAARWGRAGENHSSVLSGAASIFPERTEVTPSTWFDLASLTKPLVTATLAILALRSGSLKRSTRVEEVMPETRRSPIGKLVTADLLAHTSGLPAWLPLYCIADGDPKNLVSRLGEIEPEALPGKRVIYSCVGYVILGMMVERIADRALDRLFIEHVLEPLGLENELGFRPDPATRSLSGGSREPAYETGMVEAMGFDPDHVPPVGISLPDDGNSRFLGGVAGNAGLFGSVRGVARLAKEYLPGGGEVLSAAEAANATDNWTAGLEQARGWGWQLGSSPGCSAGEALSGDSFGHTGFTGVSVWCEPATRGVFVLLTNRNHPWQRVNDLHPLRRRYHSLATDSM